MDHELMNIELDAIPENTILIDLREEEDYAAGHIPGARNLPMGSLREEIRRIARFNTPILLYCYTGKKSAQAAEQLQSRGYVNDRNIGGIDAYSGRLEPELTIRELREMKGLSQSALARIIGVRQPTVAAYESGKANPGPAICDAVRRLLTVTVSPANRGKTESGRTPGSKTQQQAAQNQIRHGRKMTVRELRKASGLTQAAFAESLGICTGSVAAYEKGRTQPGPKVKAKVLEVYQVTLADSVSGMKAGQKRGRGKK